MQAVVHRPYVILFANEFGGVIILGRLAGFFRGGSFLFSLRRELHRQLGLRRTERKATVLGFGGGK